MPEIIREHGDIPHTYILNDQEFKQALLAKLVEEANEVRDAANEEETKKELADLLEVMDTLLAATGIALTDVRSIQDRKRETKGGFEKRIFLEKTN